MSQNYIIVGIDLGGTNIRIRAFYSQDEILKTMPIFEEKFAHARCSAIEMIEQIGEILEAHDITTQKKYPLILSIAVAGMLSHDGKIIKNAPNLGWQDIPFVALIQKRLPKIEKILLFNDLKAATYGEYIYGDGQNYSDILCVFVGSGVGSGFVLGGELQEGSSRVSGELGHIKVELENGRQCGCGGLGCLEAYVGGHNLTKMAQEKATATTKGYLFQYAKEHGLEAISPATIQKGAFQDDLLCNEILEKAGRYLGSAIANTITLLNPECLILGGGVLQNSPSLRANTIEFIQKFVSTPALEKMQIHDAKLKDDAGLYGVFALGLNAIKRR